MSFELEIVDIVDNDDVDVVARCFYPDEGNSVKIVRGLSEAEVRVAICHEIGHLIDWYLSEGHQSSDKEKREASADNICISLINMFSQKMTKGKRGQAVNVTVKCSECGEELSLKIELDRHWGDAEVTVEPCKCMTEKVESLESRVNDLEEEVYDLKEDLDTASERDIES